MYKHTKLKSLMTLLMAAIFSFFVFTSAAYAKPSRTPSNALPVINNVETTDPMIIAEGISGTLTLTATDANTDTMTWSITSVVNGTATISENSDLGGASSATVTYTPRSRGTGSFVAKVTDTNGGSDSITVSVSITSLQVPEPKPINYVALGDSIALGTIHSLTSPNKPYTEYFRDYLENRDPNTTVAFKSFATNGDRTNELYAKLGLDETRLVAKDNELITYVTNADIITISIGGNNLLQAAKSSSSITGYNFNSVNTTVAEQGVKDFNTHFPLIIKEIVRLNQDVKITVITMYNPYNEAEKALHNLVDGYLLRVGTATSVPGINKVINANTGLGYTVADVYTAFNAYRTNMGAVTYFYPSWSLTRNPHPNVTGHQIISNLHKALYTSY